MAWWYRYLSLSFVLAFVLNTYSCHGSSCAYHQEDKEQKVGVPHPRLSNNYMEV